MLVGNTQISTTLPRTRWQELAELHALRARDLTQSHRERQLEGQTHPVWDFLFTYYHYAPSRLEKWHPGSYVNLADSPERADWRWYSPGPENGSVFPNPLIFQQEKPEFSAHIQTILHQTALRAAQFGCFGLHEWAMVYRAQQHRHQAPLRLSQAQTDEVVDSSKLVCTHFDAYRFFTTDAAPKNRLRLTREDQVTFEQPGCLHAGMDLYKWAIKLGPLISGELLLDTFELASEIRLLDMQASPYDLSKWEIEPVKIETADGRMQYVNQQRAFTNRANALRVRMLTCWNPPPTSQEILPG